MVALCGSMRWGRCSGLDRWMRTSLHTLTRVSRRVFLCNCNPSVLLFSMDMHRRKVVDLHAIQGSANLSNSIVIFIQCRPPLQLMRGKRRIFFLPRTLFNVTVVSAEKIFWASSARHVLESVSLPQHRYISIGPPPLYSKPFSSSCCLFVFYSRIPVLKVFIREY